MAHSVRHSTQVEQGGELEWSRLKRGELERGEVYSSQDGGGASEWRRKGVLTRYACGAFDGK